VQYYAESENTHPGIDDTNGYSGTIIRTDLISTEEHSQQSHDQVRRSLIRHDSDKLAASVIKLLST
jgi:hypothetical protein